jgi:hypothetical protein
MLTLYSRWKKSSWIGKTGYLVILVSPQPNFLIADCDFDKDRPDKNPFWIANAGLFLMYCPFDLLTI